MIFNKDIIEKNQKPAKDLMQEYVEHLKNNLGSMGVSLNHEIIRDGERSKVIGKIFKNNEYQGQIRRTFEPLGVELSKIELNGGTGLVNPIYKAERQFFEQNNLAVKTNLVNPITQRKFMEHYPEAINWGDRTMWRPSSSILVENTPKASSSLEYIMPNIAPNQINKADPILDAIKSTPSKVKKSSGVAFKAIETALKRKL